MKKEKVAAEEKAVEEKVKTPKAEEEKVEEVKEEKQPKAKKKRKRKKLIEYTPENDIKHRGPLSYRHLRIFAWSFFAISQIAVILSVGNKAGLACSPEIAVDIISFFRNFMMPLFLLANFSFILRGHANFKSLIIKFSASTLGFAAGYYIIYEHYLVGLASAFLGDAASARSFLDYIFLELAGGGAKTLNVFLDLLLCTLLFYFLMYVPKKHFQGKKIIIFRLFAILPVLYEMGSLAFKFLGLTNVLPISPYAYPALTCKPPMTFVAFIAIAIFFKFRKRHFLKKGKTEEEYERFLTTKANSWQVARIITYFFIAAAAIDILIMVIVPAISMMPYLPDEEAMSMQYIIMFLTLYDMGFGGAIALLAIIPFTLLFDYTKEYKNKKADIIIPIAGIAAIAFIYLEGFFQLTKQVPDLIERLIERILPKE